MKYKFLNYASGAIFFFLLGSSNAFAHELQQILQKSFQSDPELLEAQADIAVAKQQTEQAVSGHYPTLSVFAKQDVLQHQRYNAEKLSNKFTPGASAVVNLYSFGAIEKQVEKGKANEEAFTYKYDETKENVAYKVAELYLNALKSKESLSALQESYKRLQTTLREISAITDSDEGRQSEYVQAEARIFAVEQQINSAERELSETLNKLKRYTKVSLLAKQLSNPFNGLNLALLQANYTQDKAQHPSYQTANANVKRVYAEMEAEKAKRYPKIDLVGQATKDEQQAYVNVSWDLFNRASNYSVQERASLIEAERSRLESTMLDLEEKYHSALINLKQYQAQTNTLKKQVRALYDVIEYYKLQFLIAKRTLLELLNAENELLNAQLSRVNADYQYRHAVLDYLYSQGTLSKWAIE